MEYCMKLISTKLIFLLGSLLFIPVSFANEIRVVDGDTVEINGKIFRLHGIDAPEAGQKCARAGGGSWPCGKSAIAAIETQVSSGKVQCNNKGKDEYGRIIGVCSVAGKDINAWMVANGFAWAFRKFSDDYGKLEDRARSKGKGIWQAETQTAWDFRAERWKAGDQKAPLGCPIKGNISRNGKIYHAPWSPWYTRTRINTSKGERWFCSEAEALNAGWRAPYWGR